ncbi:putative odorant receptor 71a [Bradysia coprophila]|uniref:putative odorant receptor 71a n=1 Tax=Bradysia coprophila TaxID=38358 RepID=UPI00187D7BA7|nr:putative odorant receptor 71a [Bradysia coprophila]
MHSTQVHKVINQIISFCRRIGLWHGEDIPTSTQLGLKSLCCIYICLFPISFGFGAITSETIDDSIFLAELSVITVVLTAKIVMLLWKQKSIMGLLDRICVFSIRYDDDFAFFNDKVEKFIKFVNVFGCGAIVATLGCSVFTFIGETRTFVMDFGFPLDWRNSEIGFWVAYIFFTSENVLTFLPLSHSVIIWYLLLHCSLRYKILGMEIKNLGRITGGGKVKMSEKEQQTIFYRDLVASIRAHLHLRESIDELESFLSTLFLLQLATSGLCICGSIYCLAFDVSDNIVERIVHVYSLFNSIAELFMITYLGNEILLSSSHLTYSLFESEWIGQPHSTIKCIIIFGEYLKRSHEMLIGKLYPLTLETFTRILKSSYSLFNILKNTKQ